MVTCAAVNGTPEAAPSRGVGRILVLAAAALVIYAVLAGAGDLRERIALLLTSHGLLLGGMLLAYRWVGRGRALRWAVGAALLFRLVSAAGAPALSDDVYRYVWDGRVQLHGTHPYAHSPLDPELEPLRDADWEKINHPELRTIYPPLSQVAFAGLAALGLGPTGFRVALGIADFGVVLLLLAWLRRRDLPQERVLLYAWNPLAVLETAGSGHVEPLGVLAVVAAAGWLAGRRNALAGGALACAIQIKLLPLVLVPGFILRTKWRGAVALVAVLVGLTLPYAVTGPAVGDGLFAYAERWEFNATLYTILEVGAERLAPVETLKASIGWLEQRIDAPAGVWAWLYGHVWPRELARLAAAALALVWTGWVVLRLRRPVAAEILLVFGGVLLLTPTLHPWYLLWVLPWAAVERSWPWLVLAAMIPLAYAVSGDVPPALKLVEFLPPLALAVALRVVPSARAGVRAHRRESA